MLALNPARRLAEVAADAARRSAASPDRSPGAPWRRARSGAHLAAGAGPGGLRFDQDRIDDELARHLVGVIRVAVVGGPGSLGDVLTEDVRGWSPALAFDSRAQAEKVLAEEVTSITVLSFEVDSLVWADPIAVAEWRIDATVDDLLLVADDVLVESGGRPLALMGATVAELRGGRASVVHTYYDEAALIEQVIL